MVTPSELTLGNRKMYKNRFFYNSSSVPSQIEALLARKSQNCTTLAQKPVNSRVFTSNMFAGQCKMSNKRIGVQATVSGNDLGHPIVQPSGERGVGVVPNAVQYSGNPVQGHTTGRSPKFESIGHGFESDNNGMSPSPDIVKPNEKNLGHIVDSHTSTPTLSLSEIEVVGNRDATSDAKIEIPLSSNVMAHGFESDSATAKFVATGPEHVTEEQPEATPSYGPVVHCVQGVGPWVDKSTSNGPSVNIACKKYDRLCPLYDVNNVAMEDKFINTIIFANQGAKGFPMSSDNPVYNKWQSQVDFPFGFVPLGDQIMPENRDWYQTHSYSPIQMHDIVRSTGKPNFLGARLPVMSQLNVEVWQSLLKDYWDQQLLQLLRYGFPLDFNRACPLSHESGNHKSADEFPTDVDAYIEEECRYGAILGPFQVNPIANVHNSPFMTRNKPNSDRRRVIIDLSWPLGASVNSGIDKNTYLDTPFSLTFPTVDDITAELKRIGRGALLYKIDVSRAFRHVKVDPGDYDLLGLHWRRAYVDTCLPFGTRHGSQIFQRLSDAVRYMMRQKGFRVIDYIDDYVGVGVPHVAHASYASLFNLMQELGLTISDKKLVPPSTKVVCLGVIINTEEGTVSIPPDKLRQINDTVKDWLTKRTCTKRQLQSLLGLLLYVHKCVKPARAFLNRMLALLRSGHASQRIDLTADFKRDLSWFGKFLPMYNGVSLYDHRPIDFTLELDACLTGLGGRWSKFVYHLPIPRGFMNWSIVHLEMVNILLAVRLFQRQWSGRRVLIRCDNEAVVTVLRSGKTRDPYLGACARNIWYVAALADIDLQYAHIRGLDNGVADLLSRWTGSTQDVKKLLSQVQDPVWVPVDSSFVQIDAEL